MTFTFLDRISFLLEVCYAWLCTQTSKGKFTSKVWYLSYFWEPQTGLTACIRVFIHLLSCMVKVPSLRAAKNLHSHSPNAAEGSVLEGEIHGLTRQDSGTFSSQIWMPCGFVDGDAGNDKEWSMLTQTPK